MCLFTFDFKKLKMGPPFLKFFVLFFLSGSFVTLTAPVLFAEDSSSGPDKKKLSEEEEIAQMMDQLQKFKISWEQKKSQDTREPKAVERPDQSPKAAPLPKKTQTPPSAEPQAQSVKFERPVKINPPAARQLPRTAQIKTEDGKIRPWGEPSPQTLPPAKPVIVPKTEEVKPSPIEVKPSVPIQRVIASEAKFAAKPGGIRPTNLAAVSGGQSQPGILSAEQTGGPANLSRRAVAALPRNDENKGERLQPAESKKPAVVQPLMRAAVVPAEKSAESKKPAVVPLPPPASNSPGAAEEEILVFQDDAARYQAAQEEEESKKSARHKESQPAGRHREPSQPALISEKKPELIVERDDAKKLDRSQGVTLPADADGATRAKWEAARQQKGPAAKAEPPKPNVFADTFYLRPDQRLAYNVYDIDGFIFIKAPNFSLETQYAIVTGFGGDAMKTRAVPGLQTLDDAKQWVHDNLETAQFEGVEIKKLHFGKKKNGPAWYWVGQKAFATPEAAQQEVAMVQSVVELQGRNFAQVVSEAAQYAPVAEAKKPVDIHGPANFEKEEALILKYLDQMDIGEKLFGTFQGEASGEKLTWQSFGETTFRKTNLTAHHYDGQVGYWTNRFVFKGIRFPMSTVDPFLEVTAAFDSTSVNYASNVKFFAGLEWRPFARNPWLANYRPWGGINVLEWIKNYRFYIMYGDRKNTKNPITGSANSDLIGGVQIFYEWGVELPPLDTPEPKTFSDYVERYFWGEYFGDYRFEKTNFSAEKVYDGVLLNSSLILGLKIPGIPLPENSLIDELAFMPYVRYEHINSTEFSFLYQNRYFVAVGCRWMPFRNYRFKENEWLSKTKIFAEYVGVGKTQQTRGESEPPNNVRTDLRFGLSFSSRRY